jgi:hypothetical protein
VAGALEVAATAELPDELQAVTSKAAQAIHAQVTARRALHLLAVHLLAVCLLAVNMDFQPLNIQLFQ